jgi:hypothetical protein
MKVTPLTVIIFLFASVMLVRLVQRVARDGVAVRSALVWGVIWLSLAVFSIFPDLLNDVIEATGMGNRLFFLLTIAVLVLFALVFHLTSRVDRMHRDVGLTIRELAIANYRIESLRRGSATGGERLPASTPTTASGPRNLPQEPVDNDVAPMRQHPLDHSG